MAGKENESIKVITWAMGILATINISIFVWLIGHSERHSTAINELLVEVAIIKTLLDIGN